MNKRRNYFYLYFLMFLSLFFFSLQAEEKFSNSLISPSLPTVENSYIEKLIIIGDEKHRGKLENFDGITIDENLMIPDKNLFIEMMQKHLHHSLNYKQLEGITKQIENFYRNRGYPIVVAKLLGDQDVTNGFVKIFLLVGRLGDVKAKGAKYFSNKQIAEAISLQQNDYIRSDVVLKDLLWINDNPFRSTELIYEKGEQTGQTNIILLTQDRFPLRVFGGYENNGNKIAGRDRFQAGFTWGNAWGLSHQINYQFFTAKKYDDWHAHTASYIAPLPMRHYLKVFGSYSRSHPDEGNELDLTGEGWQVSGRYIMPFVTKKLRQHATGGYDFKRTNNFLTFVQDSVFNKTFDISQFLLGYDLNYSGKTITTYLGVDTYISPGKMTKNNTDEKFQVERPNAKSNYIYARAYLNNIARFFWDFSWVLSASGQLSQTPLLPSEAFAIGGYATVRGYKENQLIGDKGYLLKNEIRTPSYKMSAKKRSLGEIQFLIFNDLGRVFKIDPNIPDRRASSLLSAGVGLRYNYTSHISLRADWGVRLNRASTTSHGFKSRVHVGVNAGF